MSYILDAIKKSDQQRDLGTTPDVNTIHETPSVELSQRPTWLYGLAIVLLLNAGGLGWWLWAGNTSKTTITTAPEKPLVAQTSATATTQPQAPPQAKTAAPAPAVQPASPPVAEIEMPPEPGKAYPQAARPPPPQAPAKAPPPPALADSGKASAVETKVAPPVPQQATVKTKPVLPAPVAPSAPAVAVAPKTPAGPKSPVAATVAGAVSTPTPGAPPPAAAATTSAKGKDASTTLKDQATGVVPMQTAMEPAPVEEEPIAEEEAPTPTDSNEAVAKAGDTLSPIASTVAPRDKKQGKEGDPPEIAKLPLVNQLPQETQQSLPELHISFHSYSIKPSARLVSISGKILREGEAFDETVKLETITPQGVVMAAKERRFRVKVNPNAR